MWIVYNEALLRFVAGHPGDTTVVPFSSLRDGYPLAATIEERWGLGLTPVVTADVFEPAATSDISDGAAPAVATLEARLHEVQRELERLALLSPSSASGHA
jgi:hypothetical protein